MIQSSMTKQDAKDAREALSKILDAQELITIAKACELDCAEDDARCQQMKGFLTKFLEIFGDKFPTR